MLDIIVIVGAALLSVGFLAWTQQGLELYFATIKDIDEKSNGSHRDRRD